MKIKDMTLSGDKGTTQIISLLQEAIQRLNQPFRNSTEILEWTTQLTMVLHGHDEGSHYWLQNPAVLEGLKDTSTEARQRITKQCMVNWLLDKSSEILRERMKDKQPMLI